jgi:multiple sugar transport system ATP-binding protein
VAEFHFRGVTKRFGSTVAVAGLELAAADGEFIVLLGPTGAGKTTTLRLLAGLEHADAGSIAIGGRDVSREPPAARDVAFVFQQFSLYPHLSVFDNLAFPLRSPALRTPADAILVRVREIARLLQIEDKLDSRATQLSGGQMQRVAIGRALVRRPSIYLMDEPLSSLDAKLRADLRLELKRIQQELGATILYVTHDQIEAMTLATRIGVLDRGRLVQLGTPRQIYESPVNTYVATRLGSPGINLLPRRLLPHLAVPSSTEFIGARTEHVRVGRALNGATGAGGAAGSIGAGAAAAGRVTWIEHLGDQNHLHVQIEEHDLVTLVDPSSGLAVGDAVEIDFVRPLYFGAAGERLH